LTRSSAAVPTAITAGLPALVLGLAGLLTWSSLAVPAAAAPTVTMPPAQAGLDRANQRVNADRARAAQISGEIQAEGLLLAKYAERADAESVKSGQLDVKLRATRSAARSASMEVLSARKLLVTQALAAYTEGGAFSYSPGTVQGSSLVVAAAYAEVVAQRQQFALGDYRRSLTRDKAVSSELSHQIASVRAATRLLAADRAAASAQQVSLRTTLAGVKGDFAVAVNEVERQQAAVQAEEEKALLASTHQLPRPTAVMAAVRAPSPGGRRADEATTGLPAVSSATASSAAVRESSPASTQAATTSTTGAPAESQVPLAATTSTLAPTTTAPLPASSATTSTSAAPTTTSVPPSTVPSTTTTTSPPATTSTSATSLVTTTLPSTGATALLAPATTFITPTPSSPAEPSTSAVTTTPEASSTSTTSAVANNGAAGTAAGQTEATYPTTASTTVTTLTTPTTAAGGYSAALPAAGWQVALAFAESQMGKPYQWGGAGPATYDCSGLTMVSWAKAGVDMPHSAQDQYDMTTRVPMADLQPGDLVFFGTPTDVYHVGMYVGGGNMVDAPETGQDVMIQPIYELNLLGGGRP
jgi:peptidoglycan DL-endopeptidase CwlO